MKALDLQLIIGETNQTIVNLHFLAGILENQTRCEQAFSRGERLRLAANHLSEVIAIIKSDNFEFI